MKTDDPSDGSLKVENELFKLLNKCYLIRDEESVSCRVCAAVPFLVRVP